MLLDSLPCGEYSPFYRVVCFLLIAAKRTSLGVLTDGYVYQQSEETKNVLKCFRLTSLLQSWMFAVSVVSVRMKEGLL